MVVAKPTLRTFDRYRYGKRSFLYPGYRFRASGGPVFLARDEEGNRVRIPMNETGVFTFIRYCECGASKWVEGHREGYGTAVIYVGRIRPSPRVEGLQLRPHKIRTVRERQKTKRQAPLLTQKALFF